MPSSIARQSIEQLGGEASILTRQRRDHEELDRLMRSYDADPHPPEERQQILKDIIQLTFTHAFAEETVLWPALRRLHPDGDALTSRVEQEHQEINVLVAAIERTDPAHPRHRELTSRAFDVIRQDIRDEEDLLLPRLQEASVTTGHDCGGWAPPGKPYGALRPHIPIRQYRAGLPATHWPACR
ncbi:hemerythrin domain-containing protein [Streptomyces sp. NPDC054838]